MSMPCSMRSRASVPSRMSLAAMIALLSAGLCRGGAALEVAYDVGLLLNHQFFAVDLDFGARPFPEQHAVSGFDVERMHLSVFPAGTRPDSDDLAFHWLFLSGVGNDDPSRRLRFLLDAPPEHGKRRGNIPNVKISTTRRWMRSTLASIHFASSMTNASCVFGHDGQRE